MQRGWGSDWVMTMMNKYSLPCSYFWLTIGLVLVLPLLAGCSNSQFEATVPTVTIELTEIVDKTTQSPITENTITLRWESSDGDVLDTQEYSNQSSLSTSLLADGDKRLWVKVEAKGYQPWENAIRMKMNSDKPLYIKVEKEWWDAIQG
jgi:spore coat protein CotH